MSHYYLYVLHYLALGYQISVVVRIIQGVPYKLFKTNRIRICIGIISL